MLLSIFLGIFGIDRFYLGYPFLGILKFASFGGFVVGNLVDIILIGTQVG
jgi:TM2 domain-containing membrane protein YozV